MSTELAATPRDAVGTVALLIGPEGGFSPSEVEAARQAGAGGAETWYLSRITRAIVLIRVTPSNPGPPAGVRAARSGKRNSRTEVGPYQAYVDRIPARLQAMSVNSEP